MAENPDIGANGGHADSGNFQMPEPATALRILKLVKEESDAWGWTFWLSAPLEHATNRRDMDLAAALLDAGADPTQVDSEGIPILGVASMEGHAGAISAIAARHPEALNQTEAASGYGALHHAAKHNKTEAIDALAEAGADLDLKDANGCTALHVAAATTDCEAAVEALVRHGADMEQREDDDLTPLLVAFQEGNEAAATVLMEAGAVPLGGLDSQKVLKLAISGGSSHGGARGGGCISIMRTLVQRGVDVNASSAGGTAMHWAAWCDNGRAIDFLVEMGADVEARAYEDSTPFHIAAQSAGNLSASRALKWHGADIHARQISGDTPLHVAANNCFFEQSAATVDALLRAGADETMVNAASETPADVLKRVSEGESELLEEEENDRVVQIRTLLANAPADRADRAWARRSFMVMCRALPDRVRLTNELPPSCRNGTATESAKKAALRKAGDGEMSNREEDATNSAKKMDIACAGDFSGAMSSLIGLQAELFRAIVEFL